jgi:leucine-rich repeat protein SHOC2
MRIYISAYHSPLHFLLDLCALFKPVANLLPRTIQSLPISVSIFPLPMAASTSTSADVYDVFINHRRPDVKKTLASHLYHRLISHGLQVFLDYQELNVGENFDSEIKGAIKSASVHVAIFSQTYAESKWCLNELQLMLESGSPIIPVFYKVKPADLRWTRGKDGVYAQALSKLEEKRTYDSQPRYDPTTVENWRNALFTVSGISGFELDAFNG